MSFLAWLLSLFTQKADRPENSGVLLGNQPTDYFVGSNSPIEYKIRLQTGDWTPYAFDQERQYSNPAPLKGLGDSMACVTHSAINSIEAQQYFLTGKQINYSKRWIAKMSGTTKQGNYLYKVADTIRQYGLVLEEDYPAPPAPFTWEQYHADIPADKLDELKKKGQDWLSKWNVQYEFLQVSDPNLDFHLKHSPIQIVIPGHAVCGVYSPDQLMTYLDSYEPWLKKHKIVELLSACKIILTPRMLEAGFIKFNNSPEVWFMAKMDSTQRMDKFRLQFSSFDSDYSVSSAIVPVSFKKPF